MDGPSPIFTLILLPSSQLGPEGPNPSGSVPKRPSCAPPRALYSQGGGRCLTFSCSGTGRPGWVGPVCSEKPLQVAFSPSFPTTFCISLEKESWKGSPRCTGPNGTQNPSHSCPS